MVNNILLSGMAWASSLKDAIVSHLRDEDGQDIMEYAVLAGAIALTVALILGFGFTGALDGAISTFRDKITGCLTFDSAQCQV